MTDPARFGKSIDALVDCRLERFRSNGVTSAVPEECFPGLGFGALLDPELPTRHALLARENALAGVVPAREFCAARIYIRDSISHFFAPRTLDIGEWLAHAVEQGARSSKWGGRKLTKRPYRELRCGSLRSAIP
jgi:hypothetical protein